MTTSPEALREAVARATANLSNTAWTPRRAHYEGMRNQLAAAEAALQEAREALGPFEKAWRETFGQDDPSDWPPGLDTAPAAEGPCVMRLVLADFRRAAEVYRALSPGGADA